MLAAVIVHDAAGQNTLYTFEGDAAGDFFGSPVSRAGDVNNDGYQDLIIGSYRNGTTAVAAGAVRVISGKDQSILHTFVGGAYADFFGFSAAGAGDVDGDGFDDLIIGAPGDDTAGVDAGSAVVHSGRDGSVLHTFYGRVFGDKLGNSVASAGDADQDGHADLAVGSRFRVSTSAVRAGMVTVYSGYNGSVIYEFVGTAVGDSFGHSIALLGDLNNGGSPDFLFGIPGDDFSSTSRNVGSVFIVSGENGFPIYKYLRLYGDDPWDEFGWSVANAGDVDRDGVCDFIVGAPGDDDTGDSAGSARVFSGADGSILYTFYGDSPNDLFGSSVAGAGDVNGDGHADLIVGARLDDDAGDASGSARILSGADGSVLSAFNGDAAGDQFGQSVSGIGDVNRDGFDDVFVGAWLSDDAGRESGSAQVISGLGWSAVGQSCTVAPCNTCPNMTATTSGLSVLGNSFFSMDLINAPTNMTYAILVVSDPCVSPGIPSLFCDTIKLPLPAHRVIGMGFGPGTGTCGATVRAMAPIPLYPGLVGTALGFQWAVSCGATTPGTSISNCVNFVVTNR